MKKLLALLLTASMLLAMLVTLAAPVAAEDAVTDTFDANAESPTISTAADYIAFFNTVFNQKVDFDGKTITMLHDVVLNDTTSADWFSKEDAVKLVGTNDGWAWFKGTFDGGNHTLKGAIVEGSFRSDRVLLSWNQAIGIGEASRSFPRGYSSVVGTCKKEFALYFG